MGNGRIQQAMEWRFCHKSGSKRVKRELGEMTLKLNDANFTSEEQTASSSASADISAYDEPHMTRMARLLVKEPN